jgi:hypothetical protein
MYSLTLRDKEMDYLKSLVKSRCNEPEWLLIAPLLKTLEQAPKISGGELEAYENGASYQDIKDPKFIVNTSPVTPGRLCPFCNKPIERRPTEAKSNFLKRRYCSPECVVKNRHKGPFVGITPYQKWKSMPHLKEQDRNDYAGITFDDGLLLNS